MSGVSIDYSNFAPRLNEIRSSGAHSNHARSLSHRIRKGFASWPRPINARLGVPGRAVSHRQRAAGGKKNNRLHASARSLPKGKSSQPHTVPLQHHQLFLWPPHSLDRLALEARPEIPRHGRESLTQSIRAGSRFRAAFGLDDRNTATPRGGLRSTGG